MINTDGIDQFCLLILAGLLTQLSLEKAVNAKLLSDFGLSKQVTDHGDFDDANKMCQNLGAGYWSELSLLPLPFAIIYGIKASNEKILRFSLSFVILFVLTLIVSDFGSHALKCAGLIDTNRVFEYASIVISDLIAVAIAVRMFIG